MVPERFVGSDNISGFNSILDYKNLQSLVKGSAENVCMRSSLFVSVRQAGFKLSWRYVNHFDNLWQSKPPIVAADCQYTVILVCPSSDNTYNAVLYKTENFHLERLATGRWLSGAEFCCLNGARRLLHHHLMHAGAPRSSIINTLVPVCMKWLINCVYVYSFLNWLFLIKLFGWTCQNQQAKPTSKTERPIPKTRLATRFVETTEIQWG